MNMEPVCNKQTVVGGKVIPSARTAELQQIMRTANESNKPVFAYLNPNIQNAARLNLENFDRILEIDPTNLVVTVESNVKLGDLAKALSEKGLRFIPADFYQNKSVGEFYYEGISNICSLKYGPAKHFLMGSEIVLPSGEILNTGGKTVKNVTGYDMTRFMNSSYANLGVTVKFLLKIHPIPEKQKVCIARFKDYSSVNNFVETLKDLKILPVYFVWADENCQSIIGFEDKSGNGSQLVLFELDGVQEEVEQQWLIVEDLLENKKAVSVTSQDDEFTETGLFSDLFTPSSGFALIDEFKIKYSDQSKFVDQFYSAVHRSGVRAGLFGQIAEGKLSVRFADKVEKCTGLIDSLTQIVSDMNGFSSGRYKRLLGSAPTGVLAEIEERLKKFFDPKGILKG